MNEQRVSDGKLSELVERAERAAPEYMFCLFPDERPLVLAAFRELWERRSQRCETCDWHGGNLQGSGWTRAICNRFSTRDYLHTGEMTDGCSWWQAPEEPTDG